jgi:hypothetical protein
MVQYDQKYGCRGGRRRKAPSLFRIPASGSSVLTLLEPASQPNEDGMTTPGVEPVLDSYRPDRRVGAETSTCSDDAIRLRDYDTRRGVRGVRNGIRSICDLSCHHLDPHQ